MAEAAIAVRDLVKRFGNVVAVGCAECIDAVAVVGVFSVLTVALASVGHAYIPIDRFPAHIAALLRTLPSTQFIDAFRGVAMQGNSLAHYGGRLAMLGTWTIAGTALSARYLRWV